MIRLGDSAVESFYQLYQRHNESKFWSLLHEPLGELPQVCVSVHSLMTKYLDVLDCVYTSCCRTTCKHPVIARFSQPHDIDG